MNFSINALNDLKNQGYLINQQHPTHPLLIWNYSQKTQYEGFWNEITTQCRGLVTDLDGNVISKGFPKFWNWEENKHTPTDIFDVWEKLDGQYIGVFWYKGEMIVNSRGSFTSPYAIEAKRILEEKYPEFVNNLTHTKISLNKLTYCFELVGFEQIVVSYPETDLILTGIFNIHGTDWFNELKDNWDLQWVKNFAANDLKTLKQLNMANKEGFVICFSNGSRCKIKFDDYVKLHRQMTNLSTTAIWEALKDGKPVSEILNDVPDEFFSKVRKYENLLKSNYNFVLRYANQYFEYIQNTIINTGMQPTKRSFASLVFTTPHEQLSAVLFNMYDGRDYSEIIWKLIKPKYEKI